MRIIASLMISLFLMTGTVVAQEKKQTATATKRKQIIKPKHKSHGIVHLTARTVKFVAKTGKKVIW